MKVLIALTALFCVAYAEYDANCVCYASIGWRTRLSAAQLPKDIFNDSPKPETCDKAGMEDCTNYCVNKMQAVTNDFTLNKPPTVDGAEVKAKLGQYLCNMIGRNVQNQEVRLMAGLDCSKKTDTMTMRSSSSATTGHSTSERLTCQDGKYVASEEAPEEVNPQ